MGVGEWRASAALQATPASCAIRLQWEAPSGICAGYHVYRSKAGAQDWEMHRAVSAPQKFNFVFGYP